MPTQADRDRRESVLNDAERAVVSATMIALIQAAKERGVCVANATGLADTEAAIVKLITESRSS